jgi:enoyl-CoA hydratase
VSADSAVLSLAEAVGRLCRPDAGESFSPVTGAEVLVVDLGCEGGRIDSDAAARAGEALGRLPSPSIAVRTGPLPASARRLLDRFDVVAEDSAGLEELLRNAKARPLASMALVQLLRQGSSLDTEGGLFAESLVYSMLQGGPEFKGWLATRPAEGAPARSAEPAVRVRRELDHLHLYLNRPERHNAFSAEMRDGLCEALQLALCDDSIDQVILSGEGRSFCSGGDLSEFGTLPDPATAHAIRSTRNAASLLAACAGRLRAEVHGACIGAGAELPAFAARVVARDDAYFQLPELAMGLVPGAGGTVSLPRRIGRQRTAWLALSGRRIDAPTALAWGLADELRRSGSA